MESLQRIATSPLALPIIRDVSPPIVELNVATLTALVQALTLYAGLIGVGGTGAGPSVQEQLARWRVTTENVSPAHCFVQDHKVPEADELAPSLFLFFRPSAALSSKTNICLCIPPPNERRLAEDVGFRVLAAGSAPNFRTIADFRKLHLVS